MFSSSGEEGGRQLLCWIPWKELHLTDYLSWAELSWAELSWAELSTLWEPASLSNTQEFPNIWWNPEVHHSVHMYPFLDQIDPVDITPFYFSKMNFNIVHLTTSLPSYRPLFLWLFHQIALSSSLLPLTCYIPCLSRPFWFYRCIWVCHKVQVLKSNGALFLSYLYPPHMLFSLFTFHTFISLKPAN
jgi:hypothetical protein